MLGYKRPFLLEKREIRLEFMKNNGHQRLIPFWIGAYYYSDTPLGEPFFMPFRLLIPSFRAIRAFYLTFWLFIPPFRVIKCFFCSLWHPSIIQNGTHSAFLFPLTPPSQPKRHLFCVSDPIDASISTQNATHSALLVLFLAFFLSKKNPGPFFRPGFYHL